MRAFVITAIILFILTLILQIDDKLTDESLNWIERLETRDESESYLYLLGFSAVENVSPLEQGTEIYKNILAAERQYFAGNEFEYEDMQTETITLPEGEWFCSFEQTDCLSNIIQSLDEYAAVLEDNKIFLERLQVFLNYGDFRILSNPLLDSPIPPYLYLSRAERMFLLSQLKLALVNKAVPATLTQHIQQLQAYQVSANTLLSKMIFTKYVADAIDVLWYLKQVEKFSVLPEIEILNPVSVNMDDALIHEFGFAYHIYTQLDKHPEFMEEFGNMPGWTVRLLFKPNMTINKTQEKYQNIVDKISLSPARFAELIAQPEEPKMPLSIRNPVGLILLNVAEPNFTSYIGRIHNLNLKIMLYQNTDVDPDGALSFSGIHNSYSDKPESAFIHSDQQLCFRNPFAESKQFETCLHIY